MNIIKTIIVIMAGSAILGCDTKAFKDPPLAITFRHGLLSKQVLQVNNLSTAEGIKVYVYVSNESNSTCSGSVVVPANSAREFGALEMNWDFKPGDRGFVRPDKYGKKLFFEILSDNQYRSWFGLDDIPEEDVAEQVRVRQVAEHAAWLKAKIEALSVQGSNLFVAITHANAEREAAGLGSLWPKPQESLKDRTKDTLRRWKEKIAATIGKDNDGEVKAMDISEKKFKSSTDYFDCLFDVRSMGSGKCSSYVAGADVGVVSSVRPKDGCLSADAVKWSVLADATDDMSDDLPILVSANFPCEKLRSFWDGKENANDVIPLSDVGDTKNEALVVVYKSGQVKSFPSTKVTLGSIYGGAFNTFTNGYNRQLKYITPQGEVNATGVIK